MKESVMAEPMIRVYYRDANGDLDSHREDYTLAQYGGAIPQVGDVIVSNRPGKGDGLNTNWNDPRERIFCEVVRRYILPDEEGKYVRISIEVKERPGTWDERAVV